MPTMREHPAQLGADWLPARTLARGARMAHPVLASAANGSISLAWEAEEAVFHSRFDGATWEPAARVCGGRLPSLAYDPGGTLYLAFSNDFSGRWEVYESALAQGGWTLPINVSFTPGASSWTRMLMAPDGKRHLVWEDDTPGFPVLYHGWHRFGWRWENHAIPDAAGRRPAAQFDASGVLHLAYQSGGDDLQRGDVFYTCLQNGAWRAPQLISSGEHAAGGVALVAEEGGRVHVAWRERWPDHDVVMYASGGPGAWPYPAAVSPVLDRGTGSGLALAPERRLHAAWEAAAMLETTRRSLDHPAWDPVEMAVAAPLRVQEPTLAADTSGKVHVAWITQHESGGCELHHAVRKAPAVFKTFIPRVVGGE